ncbi:hypothetical protein LCGC14_2114560 [marine sediment metagenome]|uniref:Uncharacterized protein n=1 Tax=marine sediment metagenome TaxID=412755 RepID=A0A0F9E662_9ZZZZ
MSEKLEITKEKVLKASETCPDAKEVLKELEKKLAGKGRLLEMDANIGCLVQKGMLSGLWVLVLIL